MTGVCRGTSDDQDCDGLKVQPYGEPGRHGPRARSVPLGGNSGHVDDRDNSIFQVTAPILLRRVGADQRE